MFPDESPDTRIFGDRLVTTVGQFVSSARSLDANIVSKRDRDLGDLFLKYEGDVVMHYLKGVRVTHRNRCQSKGAQWCLKRCHVSRTWIEFSLVECDI